MRANLIRYLIDFFWEFMMRIGFKVVAGAIIGCALLCAPDYVANTSGVAFAQAKKGSKKNCACMAACAHQSGPKCMSCRAKCS